MYRLDEIQKLVCTRINEKMDKRDSKWPPKWLVGFMKPGFRTKKGRD